MPPSNAAAYWKSFPLATRKKLKQLHEIIVDAAPGAEETISYAMPSFKLNGPLVYYAGYEHHIGFYPMPSAILQFKSEIKNYRSAKGSVQFPLDEELPVALIIKMVKFRVKENNQRVALRKKKASQAKGA